MPVPIKRMERSKHKATPKKSTYAHQSGKSAIWRASVGMETTQPTTVVLHKVVQACIGHYQQDLSNMSLERSMFL